jgi:hypothetical protein
LLVLMDWSIVQVLMKTLSLNRGLTRVETTCWSASQLTKERSQVPQ